MGEKGTMYVTGFGLFDDYEVNPSWEAVKLLPSMGCGQKQGLKIEVEQIPVDYKFAHTELPRRWAKYEPKLVVHVGVSSQAKNPTLEELAHNTGYTRKDINDFSPPGGVCHEDGECPLYSGLNMKKVKEQLKLDCEVCISDDPGRFLCDFVYYSSLYEDNSRAAFIHVPPLDQPFTAQQLADKLMLILDLFLDQLGYR